jgi:hypothetical protein
MRAGFPLVSAKSQQMPNAEILPEYLPAQLKPVSDRQSKNSTRFPAAEFVHETVESHVKPDLLYCHKFSPG